MRLPLLKSHPKERHLLIVELDRSDARVAYFHDQEGELIFGGSAVGPSPEDAYQKIASQPAKITDVVIGLPFHDLADASTVVRYRRVSPQNKIGEDEIKGALNQVPPISGEVFFEDLFNAKVDGLPTLEPAGRMGELVELNYYQASSAQDNLDQASAHTKHLNATPVLVPTAYAIAKLVAQTAPKGALVLDIDPEQTEVSLSAEGHLVGIKSFDIGGTQSELFLPALETALEDLGYVELWPEQIFLCGTLSGFEEIRSQLLAFPWTKKFNLMSFPEITVFHPVSVNLTLPADVGLNALSLLG